MRILIVVAMQAEALPIIKALSLEGKGLIKENFEVELYEGVHGSSIVGLVLNGKCKHFGVDNIGPQASTLSSFLGIERFMPSIVINVGTAGGFRRNGTLVGDVYLSSHVCYHDRRVNLPGFKEYGIGLFPCFSCEHIALDLNMKMGVVSTGSSLDFTPAEQEFFTTNNVKAKDMEAAAIAFVAQKFSVPFLAIKAITDIVDGEHPTEDEFTRNLAYSSEQACKHTLRVVEWLNKNGM